MDYYSSLYKSKQNYTTDSFNQYLNTVQLPRMSSRKQLDAPLTLKEQQLATGSFPNSKQYAKCIIPRLLKAFNEARKKGELPRSMSRATIVLILKPHKDPLDPGPYRPISLLQNNVKILAKVLALLLKVISSIIHSDQFGFMPQKATAINLQ